MLVHDTTGITGVSGRKARDFSKCPSDQALSLAEVASARVYKRPAPVRRYFIRPLGEQPSPLAQSSRDRALCSGVRLVCLVRSNGRADQL